MEVSLAHMSSSQCCQPAWGTHKFMTCLRTGDLTYEHRTINTAPPIHESLEILRGWKIRDHQKLFLKFRRLSNCHAHVFFWDQTSWVSELKWAKIPDFSGKNPDGWQHCCQHAGEVGHACWVLAGVELKDGRNRGRRKAEQREGNTERKRNWRRKERSMKEGNKKSKDGQGRQAGVTSRSFVCCIQEGRKP